MRPLLTLCSVLISSAGMLGADPAPPAPVPQDQEDLVFLEGRRPLRLCLHLQIQGRSYLAHWDDVVARLFRFLDADGDGRLSPREAEHAPSVLQLRQMIQGSPEVEADEAPRFSDLTDDPRGATHAQLKGYYHRVGVAPWQVDWVSRAQGPDEFDDRIFSRLNPGKTDSLTAAGLANAVKLMRGLDVDLDEMISATEIVATGYPGGFKNSSPLKPESGPFLLLDASDRGRSLLVAAIIKRYDTDRNGKLSSAEIGFEAELFRRLDRNGDGQLDAAELARWPEEPPDLEILLRLDGDAAQSMHLLTAAQGAPRRLASITQVLRIGAARVPLADDVIEVLRADSLEGRQRRLQTVGINQFNALDRNQDGALDSKEVYQPPFTMVALMRLADRNGDGRLTTREFQDFLDLQKAMVTRSVVITILDRDRCLFDLLDADHDHRLSRRELLTAAERLRPWLDPKSGAILRARIPHQYQIIVSQGLPPRFNSDPGAVSAGRPELRLRGPLWFRKMDRNADGDVSESEFLGTREQFRRLDRDGDGLIGLDEAEAAAAGARPK